MEKLIHVLLTVKPLPSSISSRLLPLYLCIINRGVLLVVRSVLLYTVPSQEDTKHLYFSQHNVFLRFVIYFCSKSKYPYLLF